MMDIDKIMRGDWVYTPSGYAQVTMIQDNDVIFTIIADGFECAFDADECLPIRMSRKILLDSGFVRCGAWFILNKGTDKEVIVDLVDDYVYWIHSVSQLPVMKIQYLHQLQQLCKLLNIPDELTV